MMKIRVWLKVSQMTPWDFSRENCFIEFGSLVQSFPDDPILHYSLKCKKNINHLYAFRKEQYIKNYFHYHYHNHHHQ